MVSIVVPLVSLDAEAVARSVSDARRRMVAFAAELGADRDLQARVALAVSEAATNVVVHAYPDAEGPMGLRASIDGRSLSLVVIDRGRGIVPRPDSPGLGLGLPLIATLAESLELGTGRSEETEVRMTFDLGALLSDDGGLA